MTESMSSDTPRSPQATAAIEAMRALPHEMPPPIHWTQFKHFSRARARRERYLTAWRKGSLAAGVVALTVAGAWPSLNAKWMGAKYAGRLNNTSSTMSESTVRHSAGRQPEPAVVHVGTQMAVADLEDQISRIDALLRRARDGDESHIAKLRDKRADLVDSLSRVRHAEALLAALPCTHAWETL